MPGYYHLKSTEVNQIQNKSKTNYGEHSYRAPLTTPYRHRPARRLVYHHAAAPPVRHQCAAVLCGHAIPRWIAVAPSTDHSLLAQNLVRW